MNRADEIFDVVDDNDNVIGTATRGECHSNPNLIHHTVQFAVYSSDTHKFLIAKRSANADAAPNMLAFFGEHIKSGESYEEALRRGLIEELGIKSYEAKQLDIHHFFYDQQHEIVKFYLVTVPTQKVKLEKWSLSNKMWLTMDEVVAKVDSFADQTRHWIQNILNFRV